jgi:hypothetical protein
MKIFYIFFRKKAKYGLLIPLVVTMLISTAVNYADKSLLIGQQAVTYELAKKVATQHTKARWIGSHVGEGQLYHAPDGRPEVYFFVIFKEGTPARSEAELLIEVAALRSRRAKIQKDLQNVPKDVAKTQAVMVQNLWSQMSGADQYATVVVGAHEGREPFVASYSGLPPHVFLREDAIETRRRQIKIKGRVPREPKNVWLRPLFVAFEFPPTEEQGESVFLEVRGIHFRNVPLSKWKRTQLSNEVLEKRKQKWQSWRGIIK